MPPDADVTRRRGGEKKNGPSASSAWGPPSILLIRIHIYKREVDPAAPTGEGRRVSPTGGTARECSRSGTPSGLYTVHTHTHTHFALRPAAGRIKQQGGAARDHHCHADKNRYYT